MILTVLWRIWWSKHALVYFRDTAWKLAFWPTESMPTSDLKKKKLFFFFLPPSTLTLVLHTRNNLPTLSKPANMYVFGVREETEYL